jgi:hypothetical protein
VIEIGLQGLRQTPIGREYADPGGTVSRLRQQAEQGRARQLRRGLVLQYVGWHF